MKNDLRTPKFGMVVALCVALTALWLVALYGTYEDSKREKYDVRVSPGAVTYGTHSTAIIPTVSVPMRHSSVPMISGGAVRSYAHSGHAATPSATTGSGFKMHTTSSATVHTIGSGGGSNNQSPITNHQSSSSSSRGIQTSGVSVSIPTLTLATPTYVTQSETFFTSSLAAAPGRNGRVRRVHDNGDGGYDGDYNGEKYNGQWWSEEDEEWVDNPFEGAIEVRADGTYKYVGVYGADGHWEKISDTGDPGVPVGATPWLLMLLLVGAYGIVKTMHKKQNAI